MCGRKKRERGPPRFLTPKSHFTVNLHVWIQTTISTAVWEQGEKYGADLGKMHFRPAAAAAAAAATSAVHIIQLSLLFIFFRFPRVRDDPTRFFFLSFTPAPSVGRPLLSYIIGEEEAQTSASWRASSLFISIFTRPFFSSVILNEPEGSFERSEKRAFTTAAASSSWTRKVKLVVLVGEWEFAEMAQRRFHERWRWHGYCTTNSICIVKGITRKRRLIQIMMIKCVGALCMYISEWILSRHRVICLISISYCQSDEYNVDFSVEKELNKRKGAVHKEAASTYRSSSSSSSSSSSYCTASHSKSRPDWINNHKKGKRAAAFLSSPFDEPLTSGTLKKEENGREEHDPAPKTMGWPAARGYLPQIEIGLFWKKMSESCGSVLAGYKTITLTPHSPFFFFSTVCVQGPTVHVPRMPLYIPFFFSPAGAYRVWMRTFQCWRYDVKMFPSSSPCVVCPKSKCLLEKEKEIFLWGSFLFQTVRGVNKYLLTSLYRGQWLHVLEFFDGRKREKKNSGEWATECQL